MDSAKRKTLEIKIKKTMEELEKNGMTAFYAETKEDAKKLVEELLKEGDVVSHGGSVTLKECGITELLGNGEYEYLDRSKATTPTEIDALYRKVFSADVYLTSTNAITEKGELYNVDGNSNRVAAMLYGPKRVIVVAGCNKLVGNISDAANRVKEIAAPANCVRLSMDTYCSTQGRCVSLANEKADFCSGCTSNDRICSNYVVMGRQRSQGRILVIIVGEELGY